MKIQLGDLSYENVPIPQALDKNDAKAPDAGGISAHSAARAYFPRGLEQPAGSFRFSLDSLLPAAFARLGAEDGTLADLGAGCGVGGFAALLRKPDLTVLAIEREPELCAAVRRNATLLGWSDQTRVFEADLGNPLPEDFRASAAVVLANPPYRKKGHGRLPPNPLRRRALFADGPHTLPDFCRAAAFLLRPGGRFIVIHPAAGLPELHTALKAAGLYPRRFRPVRPYADSPDTLLLADARAEPCASPVAEPPLALHQRPGGALTPQARAFCPEAVCNRK